MLWSSRTATEKLQNNIAVIKQSVPEKLRDPRETINEVYTQEFYTNACTGKYFRDRRLIEWIPEFERRLKSDPNGVVSSLDDLRALCESLPRCFVILSDGISVLRPFGIIFSITGGVMNLEKPRSAWSEFFKGQKVSR